MRVGEAFVSIRADTKGLGGDLDQAGGKIKSNLGGIASMAGGLAVGAFLGSATKDAQEAEAATTKLAAGIRNRAAPFASTGDSIAAHASKLQKLTAIDDDAIKGGAALLTTFSSLTAGVGKTGAGFDEVLTTTAGLAKFWGKDMDAASTMVGKALNDPIAGLTSLAKVGIQFTDDQKRVIKSLVDTGDTAGAQRIVLDELGKQGGKAGLEMATASEKAASSFAEMKEGVGAGLLPVMNSLGKILVPVLDTFGKLPGPVQTGLVAMAGVAVLAPRISATASALGSLGPIASKMGPQVAKGAGAIAPAVTGGLAKLGPMIASAGAALGPVLMTALPWIALVAGIVIVGVLIFKFFKSDLPGKIWDAMKDAGKWLLEAGGKIIDGLWEGLKKIGMVYKFFYFDLPKMLVEKLVDAGKWLIDKGKDIVGGIFGGVKDGAVALFDWWVGLHEKVLGFFKDAGKWLFNVGKDIVMGLVDGIKALATAPFDAVMGIAKHLPSFIKGPLGISSPSKVFATMGGNLMEGLAQGIAGSSSLPGAELAKMRLTAPTVALPGGFARAGAAGSAANGGAGMVVHVHQDLRGAVVGVPDLIDTVRAGLEAADRRGGKL